MDKKIKVETYYNEEHQYKNAIGILRDLVLKTELEETFKWMFPTYTFNNKNVLAICKFKNHFGIWFFSGVFLSDTEKVLENAQEGKTLAMRHWKFSNDKTLNKKMILKYVNEAIENQKKGKVLAPQKTTNQIKTSRLLSSELKKNKVLKAKYETLSPYKKKEFNEYLVMAKRKTTKLKRLEKIIPMIMDGVGLNDKYR